MIYAYLVDGLDYEQRQEFDRTLADADTGEKAKARREREAVQNIMMTLGGTKPA